MESELYHDAQWSDREEIIVNTQNEGIINALFDGIPGVDDSEFKKFKNQAFHIPIYDETDKFGIFYTSKGGSSAIQGILDEYDLSSIKDFSDRKWTDVFLRFVTAEYEEVDLKHWTELRNILDGKSKKDLIIVTRNPIYKWLSGLYTEILQEVNNSHILYGYIRDVHGLEDDGNLSEAALSDVSFRFLKESLFRDGSIANSHAALYNQTFYNLLELNPNIDKTKIKIVDIDDIETDVIRVLQSYYPQIEMGPSLNSFWTQRAYHKPLLHAIYDGCTKSGDKALLHAIRREIKSDYFYYSLLKTKYKNYFVK